MVSLRNFEKYFTDRPDIEGKKKILKAAKKVATKGGLISGDMAKKILGPLAQGFFQEVLANQEHIEMGLEDMAKA